MLLCFDRRFHGTIAQLGVLLEDVVEMVNDNIYKIEADDFIKSLEQAKVGENCYSHYDDEYDDYEDEFSTMYSYDIDLSSDNNDGEIDFNYQLSVLIEELEDVLEFSTEDIIDISSMIEVL